MEDELQPIFLGDDSFLEDTINERLSLIEKLYAERSIKIEVLEQQWKEFGE